MRIDHAQLRALAAVVREGSFERAAQSLNVTSSAVSQRIKALEDRVGRLLVKRSSPAVATPERATAQWRDSADSLRALGFDDEQALLPESMRSFSGHRLLQEVAAMPQRLLFFDITDLAPRLAQVRPREARAAQT